MKQNWTYKKFEDCLDKVKYTPKVPSSDYMDDGAFPIISQEEGLISGYWNKETDVFKVLKPVVIFGDHTRILKYVDFDFVLGADGVKILQPIEGLSAKFLLYYLIWCNIPSMGYSRHYKLLKELDIPVPPIETQSRIVSELDLLQSIIDKQQAQLKELDTLAQSIFYDMFGDSVENERGWEVKKLGDVFKINSGKFIDSTMIHEKSDRLFPCYGGNGLRGYVETPSHHGDYPIIGRVGALCGNVHRAFGSFYATEHALVCTPKQSVSSVFACSLLQLINLFQYAKGVAQPVLSASTLSELRIIFPPLSLQQSFAAKIESIEKQKAAISQSIAETQKLFDYTMDKYFG